MSRPLNDSALTSWSPLLELYIIRHQGMCVLQVIKQDKGRADAPQMQLLGSESGLLEAQTDRINLCAGSHRAIQLQQDAAFGQ